MKYKKGFAALLLVGYLFVVLSICGVSLLRIMSLWHLLSEKECQGITLMHAACAWWYYSAHSIVCNEKISPLEYGSWAPLTECGISHHVARKCSWSEDNAALQLHTSVTTDEGTLQISGFYQPGQDGFYGIVRTSL